MPASPESITTWPLAVPWTSGAAVSRVLLTDKFGQSTRVQFLASTEAGRNAAQAFTGPPGMRPQKTESCRPNCCDTILRAHVEVEATTQ
jgi:hypothetical protein